MEIAFRPVARTDLDLLHGWLNEPGVVTWWEGEDVSLDAVADGYLPPRDDGTHHYISVVDGVETGWIQWYAVSDSDEEALAWAPFGIGSEAAGIDYLVGNPDQRGRGLGSSIIAAFTADIVLVQPQAFSRVCASPYAANVASCRALAKAGFDHLGDVPDDEGPCALMVYERSGRPRIGSAP